MKSKRTKTREARLHSIGAFYDQADSLVKICQSKAKLQRVRTFSQEYCSDLHMVLQMLARMPGTDLVIHGPRGCLSMLPKEVENGILKSDWVVTDLNEKDLILGGEKKLRGALRQLCEKGRSERIFVVTTPPVSINNDDAQAVADELEKAFSIPIIVIQATGFGSKLGVMGYDEMQDALSLLLLPPSELTSEPYLNLISISESARDVGQVGRFLNRLGYAVNVLPNLAGQRQLALASGARASLILNPEEGGRLADFLSGRYGVPALSFAPPVGFEASRAWERAVAAFLEAKIPDAQEQIEAAAVGSLRGLRVYLLLDPWYVAPYQAFFTLLGATVCGVTVPFLDEGAPAVEALRGSEAPAVHVAQGQPFELLKVVERSAADVMVCQHVPPRAPLSGLPCVSLEQTGIFGEGAAARLLHAVAAARANAGFFTSLAGAGTAIYRPDWMKKSIDWHIKLEVS